jgi:hypothetical protein
LDEITPEIPAAPEPPPPPPAARLPFRLPAEYYASMERVPVLPHALPYGCGTASIVFLVALFAGGVMVSRGGAGSLMDTLFGRLQSEIDGQFTKDVPAAEKAEFDAEFGRLRAGVKAHGANFTRIQPLLQKITETTGDDHVTPEETEALIEALREANRAEPARR